MPAKPDRGDRARRTCLSVPCSDPRKLAKSRELGADQILLDLEDSVAPEAKDQARALVLAELDRGGWEDRIMSVRVNPPASEAGRRDLEALGSSEPRFDTVVLPKVEGPEPVELVERAFPDRRVGIEAQIESAAGLMNVEAIARSSDRIESLVFGPLDMGASLGIGAYAGDELTGYPGDIWHYARFRILVAARAVGAFAIDGPTLVLDDPDRVRASAVLSATVGYDGKWVIHPSQIGIVNDAFTPAREEFEEALGILSAMEAAERGGRGAISVGSLMLDEASRRMAERVVARGRAAGLG